MARTQLGDELRAALAFHEAELKPANCELIRLHWLEGLRLKDAGTRLGLTENEAKCRQYWAFRKLRELLPGHPEWPCLSEWIEQHFRKNGGKSEDPSHLSAPAGLS